MTANRLPEKEYRGCVRVAKTAALHVKQLVYPLTSAPGNTGIVHNLSEEGICFSLATPYSVKDHLCLSIDLVGWQHHKQGVALLVNQSLASAPLTAIAEVVWCKQWAGDEQVLVGAKFLDIFEDDLKALQTYLTNVRNAPENNT